VLWLTPKDVQAIHRAQLAEHGGLQGIRNEAALHSTLARPHQLLHYRPDASVYQLAASLGYGFARNHVFADGNKRVALMAMFSFLGFNDLRLNADEAETVVVIEDLAAGKISEEELAAWLERNTDPWTD